METKHQEIQDYYGKELVTSEDLKTNACCTLIPPPKHIKSVLGQIHDEVHAKYYGCGLTIPYELIGMKILDLGSGSGRDCYIASKLVGQDGFVVGVDMTDEQLDVANKYIDYHTEVFGFKVSNVKFLKGNIEKLDELNLEEGSFDIIISNCVINLANDKSKVLKDAYRLLKPGGEMYFSDVYSDRRVPQLLQDDPVLWGECLSGAMYWNDFHKTARNAGFTDPRTVENKVITVENEALQEKIGDINFYSVTYRLFKIEALEEDCEDYGQAVVYKGTIEGKSNSFDLDDHHNFQKGKIESVCGNTYMMLQNTRFKNHFDFFGDFSTHYGIFEGCGGAMPFSLNGSEENGSCC
ncbi:MAG: arsenite methyltransferase [Saprospiraceae bacterium]|jgi:arsenite methyltransferase|tara:strand:+ start:1358 stop:2410 length:1053 start_codon:yes stop_codon:yes gene_type:complete